MAVKTKVEEKVEKKEVEKKPQCTLFDLPF